MLIQSSRNEFSGLRFVRNVHSVLRMVDANMHPVIRLRAVGCPDNFNVSTGKRNADVSRLAGFRVAG